MRLGDLPTPELQAQLPAEVNDAPSTLAVSNAKGKPTVVGTFYNALDDLIGTYDLTAKSIEPTCASI